MSANLNLIHRIPYAQYTFCNITISVSSAVIIAVLDTELLTARARQKSNTKLEVFDGCASNRQGIGDIVSGGAGPIGICDVEIRVHK